MGLDLSLLQKLQGLRLHDAPEDSSTPQTPRNKGLSIINTPHFPGHLSFVLWDYYNPERLTDPISTAQEKSILVASEIGKRG